MELTGVPLLVLLGALVIGAPVITYALWGRAGTSEWRVLARAALLLWCQVSAVLLVAAAANDYGYFYTSWAELLGTDSGGASATETGAAEAPRPAAAGSPSGPTSDATIPGMRVLADVAWSTPRQWRTRGRLLSVELDGARSRLDEHAYVYLPPQYFASAESTRLFPGIEVMTGYPGHEQSLLSRMHYPDQELSALRAGRAGPMVLVMLRPSVSGSRDTECTDVPDGPQAMTFLSEDVPTAVEAALRVRPTGWGLVGDSTGGYCATKITLMRSDVFTAAVSFSGYYHALRDHSTGDLWDGSTVLRDLNDPLWRLHHLPEPPVGIFASIGRDEGGAEGYHDTVLLRRAVAAARGPLQLTSVVVPYGGHNFASWSSLLPRAFSWLSVELTAQHAGGRRR
jgi:enterochelin esterase-like enzyme